MEEPNCGDEAIADFIDGNSALRPSVGQAGKLLMVDYVPPLDDPLQNGCANGRSSCKKVGVTRAETIQPNERRVIWVEIPAHAWRVGRYERVNVVTVVRLELRLNYAFFGAD
jgi:hypothetical protein